MADNEAYTYVYSYDQTQEIDKLTKEFHDKLKAELGDHPQINHALGRLEREFEALVDVMKSAIRKVEPGAK